MSKLQSHELQKLKRAWRSIIDRCTNPKRKDWTNYGGRVQPIVICPQWRKSFSDFAQDVGKPPSQDHWLARLDTSKHFVKENMVWTTHAEQMRRRQFCRIVIAHGKALTSAEVCRLPNMPTRHTVLRRWEAGFSLEHPNLEKIYRRSMWLTHQGLTLPIPEWSKRIGLPTHVVYQRIKAGWDTERALTPWRLRNSASKLPTPNQ